MDPARDCGPDRRGPCTRLHWARLDEPRAGPDRSPATIMIPTPLATRPARARRQRGLGRWAVSSRGVLACLAMGLAPRPVTRPRLRQLSLVSSLGPSSSLPPNPYHRNAPPPVLLLQGIIAAAKACGRTRPPRSSCPLPSSGGEGAAAAGEPLATGSWRRRAAALSPGPLARNACSPAPGRRGAPVRPWLTAGQLPSAPPLLLQALCLTRGCQRRSALTSSRPVSAGQGSSAASGSGAIGQPG